MMNWMERQAQQVGARRILLTLDLRGRVIFINQEGLDLLQRTPAELIGHDWVETCLPERVRQALRLKFEALLHGNVSLVTNPIVTPSGEERLIEWHNMLLRGPGGVVTGTFSMGVEVGGLGMSPVLLQQAATSMRVASSHRGPIV